MIAPAALASIMVIHLAAAISPGPSFVVSVRVAATRGFLPACATAAGFGAGAALWAAALLGLGVVFQVVPELLVALKIVGALFLLLIAWGMWRHADAPLPAQDDPTTTPRSAFRLGLATQMANPKPAVFFGAVFVGVVPPDLGTADIVLILAMIFVVETAWYVIVARIFSLPGARAGYERIKSKADRVFGTILAGLGVKIALQ